MRRRATHASQATVPGDQQRRAMPWSSAGDLRRCLGALEAIYRGSPQPALRGTQTVPLPTSEERRDG